MERARAAIFDLDGTLVDSLPDIHAAVARMLGDLGRPALAPGTVRGFIGDGAARLVARCLEATGGAEPRALALFHGHYAAVPSALSNPYPGVVAALRRLAEAGVPMAVCTNKPEAAARRLLGDLRLGGYFRAVVGGDTTAALKPDPGAAARRLGRAGRGHRAVRRRQRGRRGHGAGGGGALRAVHRRLSPWPGASDPGHPSL